jgi:group I intron endonuclease
MKISGIYKIESQIKPERIYIGSAIDIQGRWRVHLHSLRNNKHHSKKLQNHYNKYGELDLVFIITEPCLPEFLIIREQHYLDTLTHYFNIQPTAGSPLGVKHSKEDNKKNSERLKGRKLSDEWRKRISDAKKGIPLSKEHIQKIANLKRGCKLSDETCLKMSEAHKGTKNSFYGKHHSEETKLKMRNRIPYNKGMKMSEAHRQKISKALKGGKRKPFSIETRENMSKARIGKIHSEQTKQNMRHPHKKRIA